MSDKVQKKSDRINRDGSSITENYSNKYCSNCGKELTTNANFCKFCGKQVTSGNNIGDNIQTGLPENPEGFVIHVKAPKRSLGPYNLVILFFVIVFGFIFLGLVTGLYWISYLTMYVLVVLAFLRVPIVFINQINWIINTRKYGLLKIEVNLVRSSNKITGGEKTYQIELLFNNRNQSYVCPTLEQFAKTMSLTAGDGKGFHFHLLGQGSDTITLTYGVTKVIFEAVVGKNVDLIYLARLSRAFAAIPDNGEFSPQDTMALKDVLAKQRKLGSRNLRWFILILISVAIISPIAFVIFVIFSLTR